MRKRRVRKHIIEDLSFNYVEKQAILCGFSMERFDKDYGYDIAIYTYNEFGEIENGQIFAQLKATDFIRESKKQDTVLFSLSKKDLSLWLYEPLPVILIVYDAQKDTAYWLYLSKYFEENKLEMRNINKFIQVSIPKGNVFIPNAVMTVRAYKEAILKKIRS